MEWSSHWIVKVRSLDDDVAKLFGIPTTATELINQASTNSFALFSFSRNLISSTCTEISVDVGGRPCLEDSVVDGKLMTSIARALGMKEEQRTTLAIMRFILLVHEAVPVYFQQYTCDSLKSLTQPSRTTWKVANFVDNVDNPYSSNEWLQ